MLCSAAQFISCRDRAFLQVFNKAVSNPLNTNDSLTWWMFTFVSPLILLPLWILCVHFPLDSRGRDRFSSTDFHPQTSSISQGVLKEQQLCRITRKQSIREAQGNKNMSWAPSFSFRSSKTSSSIRCCFLLCTTTFSTVTQGCEVGAAGD